MPQHPLIERIVDALLDLDGDQVSRLLGQAVEQNADLVAVLNEGLTGGLRQLGEGLEQGSVFIPELMMGAEIVQQGMAELEPYIETGTIRTKGKLLIGSVEGDIHDVGKNIVCSVFTAAGYQVMDLGIDVPAESFVQKVKAEEPDLVGLSTLLTTTMHNQQRVIQSLEEAGIREKVKVIIGGAPASVSRAEEIGADAYAEDVFTAIAQAEQLLN